MEGFIEGLAGGKAAMPAQYDDFIVLEGIGNFVSHFRRARGKLLRHHGDFFEQIGGLIVNWHQLVTRKGKGDGRAGMAVDNRQGGCIQIDRAMNEQLRGSQGDAAVVFIQAGFDQVVGLEIAEHGPAAFDNQAITQADAQVAAMRADQIGSKHIAADLAEHFVNTWVDHREILLLQVRQFEFCQLFGQRHAVLIPAAAAVILFEHGL